MSEGTGTSVGVISLDLRIVSKLNEQINAIAASANKSAQQSFEQVGKTVEQSISKPVENAGKTMEKAITAPLEKASVAAKTPLKAVTDQFDQTADEIGDIAARAAKKWHALGGNGTGTDLYNMISEKITDKLVTSVIWFLHKIKMCKHPEQRYEKIHSQLAIFHDATKLMGKSTKLYVVVM